MSPTQIVVFFVYKTQTDATHASTDSTHRPLRHYVVFLLLCSFIGPSTVFGSSSKLANVEQWRCVMILRNHTGGEGGNAAHVDAGYCLHFWHCVKHMWCSLYIRFRCNGCRLVTS